MTMPQASPVNTRSRLKIIILGAVQGVGFRPFVYRLANELGLVGWVSNTAQGVMIEVEGDHYQLEEFRSRLRSERPAHSFIHSCEASSLDPVGYDGFVIRDSDAAGSKTAFMLPDIATCLDCLREINNPTNRRYRYPFTNCTHCGPRFSIVESLPYDRANTSMRRFKMCPECAAEYNDPQNRRFHAQPNACPNCGPQLALWPGNAVADSDRAPRSLAVGDDALLAAAHVIRCGQIVAVKGLGGFHLMVDARNPAAVQRLRDRKRREEKPFALMFPTLQSLNEVCEASPVEEQLLCSPAAPIVILKRVDARPHPQEREDRSPLSVTSKAAYRSNINQTPEASVSCSLSPGERMRVREDVDQSSGSIANNVAPRNPYLGVMLPSNPLHHLLMAELGFPVVATSGNLSDEPICTDEREALTRLRGIADVFLVHNRPIVRHVDDSIMRVTAGRETVLRRARGFAPLPIALGHQPSTNDHQPALAVGAHLKNSVALAVGEQVFISQHIGDLETEQANKAFRRVIGDFKKLFDTAPAFVVADLHPDYLSTQFAEEVAGKAHKPLCAVDGGLKTARLRLIQLQHHIAHVLSCMADNELKSPVLGVAWDGTGYGLDGTIWGGEFFRVTCDQVERVAHLQPFRLPGGDTAVKEPRRAALGLLHEIYGDEVFRRDDLLISAAFGGTELRTLQTVLHRSLNSPLCSSVGRLFDAVAALAGLRNQVRFEGQAAMELEFALNGIETDEHYDLPLAKGHESRVLGWSPMLQAILADVRRGAPIGEISAKFHNALVEGIIAVAKEIGERRVALSGGCFQNRYLTERAIKRLRAEGFQPYWHQRIPPNDGGIALGQIMAARRVSAALAERESARVRSPGVEPATTSFDWSDERSLASLHSIKDYAAF